MELAKVSDESVEKVLSELSITREKRRRIQTMNKDELQRYLTNLYKIGVEDGANACYRAVQKEQAEAESVEVDWEDVLNVISQVAGIAPSMVSAIDTKLREVYA